MDVAENKIENIVTMKTSDPGKSKREEEFQKKFKAKNRKRKTENKMMKDDLLK